MSFPTFTSSAPWTHYVPETLPSLPVRLFKALRYEIQMRRAIREVNSLDDRTLIDIGLMSGSADDAVRRGRHL